MELVIHQNEISSLTKPENAKASRSRGKDRFPRYTRAENDLPGLGVSPHDIPIFDTLCRFRALTRQQIEAYLAPGTRRTKISLRLQKLYHHGYLVRKVMPLVPPTSLIVYLLDRKGANALAHARGCSWRELGWDPKDRTLGTQFLRHMQLLNDAYFAITRSVSACGFALTTTTDSRALKRAHKGDAITITVESEDKKGGTTKEILTHLYPDYYFLWLDRDGEQNHRFLELDNATETVTPSVQAPNSWGMKVKRYIAYWEQGKFEERYDANGMVVLTVTTSDVRLKNLKRATEKESVVKGLEKRFWFATVDTFFDPHINVLTDPIWERAGTEGKFTATEDLRPPQPTLEGFL